MYKLGLLYKLAVTLTRQQKRNIILAIDILLSAAAYLLARGVILTDGTAYDGTFPIITDLLALLSAGTIAIILLGLHKIKLNAYQMQGVVESAFVACILFMVGLASAMLAGPQGTAAKVFVVTAMTFLIMSVSSRLIMRRVL